MVTKQIVKGSHTLMNRVRYPIEPNLAHASIAPAIRCAPPNAVNKEG